MKAETVVVMVVMVVTLLVAVEVSAEDRSYYKENCNAGESVTGPVWYHVHCYEDKEGGEVRSSQGVGADVLLIEGKQVDVVAEYRYDWANANHSAYTVFRTKRSLVDIVKGWFR